MSAPRRYRLALRAYPPGYREGRGPELLATLADGDDDRGHPSTREAAVLTYRGLLQRGRIALSGEGLLAMAAGLVVVTMFFGLSWLERQAVFADGAVLATGDGLEKWPTAVLLISTFAVLGAGPFRMLESRRRRLAAAAIAFVAAPVLWFAPGAFLFAPAPSPGWVVESVLLRLEVVYLAWHVTLPFAAATAAGTWVALELLARLAPAARRQILAAGIVAAGSVAVVTVLTRPDLSGEFVSSASRDVGVAVFVTGAGMLLALVAAYLGSGSRSRPSAARRPSSD